MIIGHIYPTLTSARSPCFKRSAFDGAMKKILAADFEGGRPSRATLREMGWARARKEAAEQRAAQSPPILLEPSRIVRPGGIVVPR